MVLRKVKRDGDAHQEQDKDVGEDNASDGGDKTADYYAQAVVDPEYIRNTDAELDQRYQH